MKGTLWFDITNVPHVHFFNPIINYFKQEYNCVFSLRDFAETRSLFETVIAEPYFESGTHQGGSKIKKFGGLLQRTADLQENIPYFDVAIGVGNTSTGVIAKMRRKLSVSFDDNDYSANWLYSPFSDLAFWPDCIPQRTLRKQLFKKKTLYQYHGYKEDVYLAGYEPDPSFPEKLPFRNYVVVRPENLKAGYVNGTGSVVPDLLDRLHANGVNVLFLPRYDTDRELAGTFDNVFVPETAVNGLDACYYSDAVLTGAGTMAREAACLGVPAISFYAGSELLTVDKSLIASGKLFFSREVSAIMSRLETSERSKADLERCKMVRDEVLITLREFIENKIH